MLYIDLFGFNVLALDDESNLRTCGRSSSFDQQQQQQQQQHINNESNNSGQGLSITFSSLLRRVFEDLPHSFVQSLTECGSSFSHDGSNGVCYAAHYMRTHYYHNDGHYSCISLSLGQNHIDFGDLVHSSRGNVNGNGSLLSSQHMKTYSKFSWRNYEELLDTAGILSINDDGKKKNGLMPRQYMENHTSLAALISQKQLINTNDLGNVDNDDDDDNDVAIHATEPELCSSGVIMKWMQQQRQHLLEISSNDCEYKTPVLLDLSYRGTNENETPILLLDNSIKVNNSGVFLHAEEEENALAQQVNATVLISAIRAAAALELPVNMTAVMPLATLNPDATCHHDDIGMIGNHMMLVISLEYEPQSVCDLESFGTSATISLIFNSNFPIWRHYHLRPLKKDGENNNNYKPLEPLYKLVPMNSIAYGDDDCNNYDMHDLMNLSDHNIVPHMLLRNHQNHAYRTEVQFFRQTVDSMAVTKSNPSDLE